MSHAYLALPSRPQETSISVLPLPGMSQFLNGYYGLEECVVRGIIRLHGPPITIKKLTVTLNGTMFASFIDHNALRNFSLVTTDSEAQAVKVIVNESQLMVSNAEIFELEKIRFFTFKSRFVDFPFEVAFPSHFEIGHGYGPSQELLPPSLFFDAYHGTARVKYSINAVLEIDTTAKYGIPLYSWIFPRLFKASQDIHPFVVYDPRMILSLMNQDVRRFKSSYGAIPFEYDVQMGCLG